MIKSIYLENWKVHRDSNAFFSKGSNILLGNIGSGKSSIIDAICMALFGKFPALENKKITIPETIMFKPVKRKAAVIKLEIEFNNKNYTVERHLFSDKTNQAKLYLEGRLIAGPKQSDVTDRIIEILGIDYNLFTKVVYSEQNELDYFLKIQPAKRKGIFDELFGIIQLEDMKEGARKISSHIEKAIDIQNALYNQLSAQISGIEISSLETKRKESDERLVTLTKEISDLAFGEIQLSKELNDQKAKKLNFETLQKEHNKIVSKQESSKEKLNQLSSLKNSYFGNDLQDLEKQRMDCQSRHNDLKADLEKKKILQQSIDLISKNISFLNARLSEKQVLVNNLDPLQLNGKCDQLSVEISNTEANYRDLQNKNQEIEVTLKSFKENETFLTAQLSDKQKLMTSLEGKLVFPSKSLQEIKLLLEKLDQNLVENIQQKHVLLSFASELESSIFELKKGHATCPVCDSKLDQSKASQLITDKSKKLAEIISSQSDMTLKIKTLQNEKDECLRQEQLIKENDSVQKSISELKCDIDKINQQLLEIKDKLSKAGIIVDLSNISISLEVLRKKREDLLVKKSVIADIEKYRQELEKFTLEKKTAEQSISEIKTTDEDISLLSKNLETISVAIDYSVQKSLYNELSEQLIAVENKISLLGFNEEGYLSAYSKYTNLNSRIKQLYEQKKSVSEVLESISREISRHKELSEKLKSTENRKDLLEKRGQDISYVLKSLESSQYQLRKIIVDNINQALSFIWPKIYPYKDYLSARINASEDYILEVQTLENDWIRVEGFLSGGERTCAALGIRIAISLVLTEKLGLLILDEPTHNLDDNTISLLSNILEKDLPELVEQILIVTHDQKLLETANASRFVIERDKDNDGVSVIKPQ